MFILVHAKLVDLFMLLSGWIPNVNANDGITVFIQKKRDDRQTLANAS